MSGESDTLRRFAADQPRPWLEVGLDGRVRWANTAARTLLDRWRTDVGKGLPASVSAELVPLVTGEDTHGRLVGSGDEPVVEVTRVGDRVWLQALDDVDPAAEPVRAARRSKAAFLANMSHELRTPLNAILGYAALLLEDRREGGDASLIDDLERIDGAARHLLRMINDILDVSRIEAGRMGLFLESFEVGDLVEDLAGTIRPLARSRGNTLELEVEPDGPLLRGDRTKLRQVLLNLLDNACKFTEQGEVTLRAHPGSAEHGWVFEVTDDGVGLDPEQLEHLFEPFTQAEAGTDRPHGGTGLGLALSRLLCQLMGGRLEVDSEPGAGATFRLWIPSSATERTADASGPVAAGAGGEGTVLVIDDDPASRDLITRLLVRDGHRVLTAADGETALRLAREQRPDAITLDVMMPRVDGWEVLRRLKDDPDVGHTPVVMLSIVDSAGLGISLGASDYLTKPIDRQALLDALAPFTRRDGGRLLVVDDNPDVRTVLVRTLARSGWAVDEAEGGAAALAWLERRRPDVVLLDLLMPGIDGFQVLERMRETPEWRDIPVLVVTAKHVTAEEARRLEGGVRAIVEKGGRGLEEIVDALAPFLPPPRP